MQPLQRGDTVGIFSSSAPTNAQAIQRLVAYFEARELRVKVGPHTLARAGYMAGRPDHRAADLHALVADEDVKCIMTANGGASALQLVPLLDYNLIRRNPKPLCGLSDPTSILNAITAMTGTPTIHGPNGYHFGHQTPTAFTESIWWTIIRREHDTPYSYPLEGQIRVLRQSSEYGGSHVQGRVFGGNLRSLMYLVGTKYMPRLDHCILFIEDIGLQVHFMDSLLTQLAISGAIDHLSGLVVGQLVGCEEKDYPDSENAEDMILRVLRGFSFPIVGNVPLGHTGDKITIPIGCHLRMTLSPPGLALMSSPFD